VQRHRAPHCECGKVTALPPKSKNSSSSLTEERKEIICTTTRALQGVKSSAYPPLRKTVGTPGEKTQNLNHRGTRE
jgi:hypothetical protein